MAKTIGSILVGVGLDTTKFQKDLKNLEYSLKRTATKFKGWGQDMSMAISVPIIAGAGAAIKAFADEENAIIKMNAAIKANGKNVDTLGSEYKSFAAEIQRMTVVEDDAVIAALQLAESMKLANPQEAVQGAIGLSRAFGIDLTTALKATAKGMNGQWTALQKLIPSIKLMGTDAEKAALFQDILNNSFKVAQEETTSTSGKLLQLKNNLGDLGEQFGEILAEYIKPFVDKIRDLVFKFQELNPETKKMIVNVALLAAAVGPALLIFGQLASAFSGIIGFARTLVPLIAGMAGPFTLLAAAIGFVAWNWDDFELKFKRDLELMKIDVVKFAQAFQLIKQGNFSAATAVWKAASKAQKEINENYKTIFADKTAKAGTISGSTVPFVDSIVNIPAILKPNAGDSDLDLSAYLNNLKDLETKSKGAKGSLSWLNDEISKLQKKISENVLTPSGMVEAVKQMVNYEGKVKKLEEAVDKLKNKLGQPIIEIERLAKTVMGDKIANLLSMGRNQPFMAGLGKQAGIDKENLNKSLLKGLNITYVVPEGIDEAQSRVEEFTGSIENALQSLRENGIMAAADGFTDLFAAIATGGDVGAAFTGVFSGLLDVLGQFARMAIAAGIAATALGKALLNPLNPAAAAGAITAGIALLAITKVIKAGITKKEDVKGYASGGIFGDESLIRVGEYPGAKSNPEVVAPLDKLKDMLRLNGNGMQLSVVIDSRLQGSDLRQSIQRTETRYNRM